MVVLGESVPCAIAPCAPGGSCPRSCNVGNVTGVFCGFGELLCWLPQPVKTKTSAQSPIKNWIGQPRRMALATLECWFIVSFQQGCTVGPAAVLFPATLLDTRL